MKRIPHLFFCLTGDAAFSDISLARPAINNERSMWRQDPFTMRDPSFASPLFLAQQLIPRGGTRTN
jgi:hypothetical protein